MIYNEAIDNWVNGNKADTIDLLTEDKPGMLLFASRCMRLKDLLETKDSVYGDTFQQYMDYLGGKYDD